MSFAPIAKRQLFVVDRDGNREEFSVEIGAPYSPAKTRGMEDHAACPIEICGQADESGSEVFGIDELEALENALSHVRLLLTGLVTAGKVEWPDGRPYSLESESEFTRASIAVNKEIHRRFGGA